MIIHKGLKLYEAMTIASRNDKVYVVTEDDGVWKRVFKFSPEKELLNTSLFYSLTDSYWTLMHLNGWNASQFQDIVCSRPYYICTDIEDLFEDYVRDSVSSHGRLFTTSVADHCNSNRFRTAVRKRIISQATADRLLELCDKLQKEKEANDNK
jgi:hypothetical protein